MSILELADHVCTPRNLEALDRVAQLHVIEREMLLGKLKRDALVRLAELTDEVPSGSADEIRAFEVMRKACADLLRSGGLHTEKRPSSTEGPGGSGSRGYHPEPLTPAFEAEVLEALERLGEETNQYEPRTPGKLQSPPRRMSGFVVPPSMETNIRTGKMPMPLKSTPPPESSPESPPESPPPLEVLETRTGGTPMPPKIRSTPDRTQNTYNRILADDAHPP